MRDQILPSNSGRDANEWQNIGRDSFVESFGGKHTRYQHRDKYKKLEEIELRGILPFST